MHSQKKTLREMQLKFLAADITMASIPAVLSGILIYSGIHSIKAFAQSASTIVNYYPKFVITYSLGAFLAALLLSGTLFITAKLFSSAINTYQDNSNVIEEYTNPTALTLG